MNILPHSLETEQEILNICIVRMDDVDAVMDIMKPEYFYKTSHQIIFSHVKRCISDDNPVDITLLANSLKDSDELDQVGGVSYIATLVDFPFVQNGETKANILRDKYNLRQLIKGLHEATQVCYETQDIEKALEKISTDVSIISDATVSTDDTVRLGDLLENRIDYYESLKDQKGKVTGIPTGFKKIDEMTSGLQFGNLIVVGARPSMGKTALGLNILNNAAYRGFPGVIFSFEMSGKELLDRAISSESRVDLRRFRSGFDGTHWPALMKACEKIDAWPVFVEDKADMGIDELTRKIYQFKKRHDIKLVVIDYLQLMRVGKDRHDLEIGRITRKLKVAAKTLDIAIVLLSQLNRKLEERTNKRPVLSDLRQSGDIEQDADIVIFIYRDEVYNKDEKNPNKGIAEIDIAKHRNGPVGMKKLAWTAHNCRFENLAYE